MYSIGKLSEICNIPVKTLRYYNEIGLLEPSYIDPGTNYRYYDYDKIQIVKKITLLKRGKFPLATIKEIIESDDHVQLIDLLEHQINELEYQKEQISRQIEEMKQLKIKVEEEAPIIPGPILSNCSIEERKKITVFSIRKQIKISFIDNLVKTLFERVYAYNLRVCGHLMAIFHERDLNEKKADVELFIQVSESSSAAGCKVLDFEKYACITVKGAYSDLEVGYKRLNHWINEQNLIRVGKPFEIYEKGLIPDSINLRDVRPDRNIHPSEFVTKICCPIAYHVE